VYSFESFVGGCFAQGMGAILLKAILYNQNQVGILLPISMAIPRQYRPYRGCRYALAT